MCVTLHMTSGDAALFCKKTTNTGNKRGCRLCAKGGTCGSTVFGLSNLKLM